MTEQEQLEPGWGTFKDEAGEWRWRYVSPHNGNILADSAEGYENEGDAVAGMDAVKLAGAVAISVDHPLERVELTMHSDLPDPLPTKSVASLELRNAQRRFNVAEANLNHATDDNAERYATEYVEAERRLNGAISVIEAIDAPADPED